MRRPGTKSIPTIQSGDVCGGQAYDDVTWRRPLLKGCSEFCPQSLFRSTVGKMQNGLPFQSQFFGQCAKALLKQGLHGCNGCGGMPGRKEKMTLIDGMAAHVEEIIDGRR